MNPLPKGKIIMIPIVDYHMHTPLCGHAVGEPLEYAEAAIEMGLEEIGFADHAPFVHYEDPGITMNIKQLPEYQPHLCLSHPGFSFEKNRFFKLVRQVKHGCQGPVCNVIHPRQILHDILYGFKI